ncbi:MAG: hypothetical protein HRT82_12800 [Henriciella sp.]|nr:hypothetical protein [Henriciella sp.]
MDEALCLLFSELVGDDGVGRAIFFSTGAFRQRIELIRGVVKERVIEETEIRKISECLTKIYKAFQVRNRLLHAHYVIVVKDESGELSYVNQYFDDQISFHQQNLTPLYLGRLDRNADTGVVKVNAGTFSNHGDKLSDLIYAIVDILDGIEKGAIELFNHFSETEVPQH